MGRWVDGWIFEPGEKWRELRDAHSLFLSETHTKTHKVGERNVILGKKD